jgi:hypothetical protein
MIPSAMIAIFTSNYLFPNYGSLELPEQLSDRVISLLISRLGFLSLCSWSQSVNEQQNRFQYQSPGTDQNTS